MFSISPVRVTATSTNGDESLVMFQFALDEIMGFTGEEEAVTYQAAVNSDAITKLSTMMNGLVRFTAEPNTRGPYAGQLAIRVTDVAAADTVA